MRGVYRSEDFGRSWTMLGFTELQGGINSHVQFTADPAVLYAVPVVSDPSDRRLPVKSTDGGATWRALAADPTNGEVFTLHANPQSTAALLISSWTNLYASLDGGASFHQVYATTDADYGLAVGGVFWFGQQAAVIEANVVANNRGIVGGGLIVQDSDATIRRNTIVENHCVLGNGAAVCLFDSTRAVVVCNIIAFTAGGGAMVCEYQPAATVSSNDFFANALGDALCGDDAGGDFSPPAVLRPRERRLHAGRRFPLPAGPATHRRRLRAHRRSRRGLPAGRRDRVHVGQVEGFLPVAMRGSGAYAPPPPLLAAQSAQRARLTGRER